MGSCCAPQTSEDTENSSTGQQPIGANHIIMAQRAWRPHEGQGSRGASPQSQRRSIPIRQQHRQQQAQRQFSPTSHHKALQREKEQRPALKDFNDGGASRHQHPENLTGWKENALPDIDKPQQKSKDSEQMGRKSTLQRERDEALRECEKLIKQTEGQIRALQREKDEALWECEKLREQTEVQISALQRERDEALWECEKLRKQTEGRKSTLQRERDEALWECEKLSKQIKKLQKENAELQARNRDLLQRISSMASERMRFNNPCVEDLSDPNRHSAVQSRWQAVMNGEYWTLYEAALRKLPNEKATSGFLLRIMELAFTETQSMVGGTAPFMNQLKTLGRNDASMAALVDALERQHEFRQIVDAEARKLRKKVDSTLPQNAFEDFHKKIRSDKRNVGEELLQKSYRFADQVLSLCYLMALQTPPLALVFDSPEDKEMDTLLYEPDGDRNKRKPWIVSFVLTPPLLRHEGGPILSKGTVELK